jgi:xylitol oxidase
VTKVTLDLVPSFQMRQVVYLNLSFDRLKNNLDEIFGSGYSVSLFTDWQNHQATQVWIKSRVEPGSEFQMQPEFFGARLATRKMHPIADHAAENCTEQMGVPGPWYERLPHFRMNFTPSSGNELQSEFFVPRERAYEAISAVEQLRDEITPHLFITEFRTIAADQLWMSPCYQRPALTIHFTWKPEWDSVKNLLPKIERQLAPFDARPHWAKLFTMRGSAIRSLYSKAADFKNLAAECDPHGKFRNRFLETELFSA